MKDRFEKIYATNEWKFGSGEGSLPAYTATYRKLIEQFIRDNSIRSVLDFGCGDWQSSRLIDWQGVQYFGFDIVPAVIESNQKFFSKPNIRFQLYGGQPERLPSADLLIIKDVMQHWSQSAIRQFLPVLSRYSFCLVTNCVDPKGLAGNSDIPDGGFHPLDLRLPPYNLPAEELLTFSKYKTSLHRWFGRAEWTKKVMLVQRKAPGIS